MTTQELVDIFGFPEKAFIAKKIPKKLFLENAFDGKTAERLFTENVQSVHIAFNLKPDTINVACYSDEFCEYQEIQILLVTLKTSAQAFKIADIIQKGVPYPVVLLVESENGIMIHSCLKRRSQADAGELVAEESFYTGWIKDCAKNKAQKAFINSLQFEQLSAQDLRQLYASIVTRIKLFNICDYKKDFIVVTEQEADLLYETYQKIKAFELEMQALKKQIKTLPFAEQVGVNVKIKRLEKENNKLITRIAGE
jgi:superfamily I DNA/RNA helicase